MTRRRLGGRSGAILLGIGMGGLIVSMFVEIPTAIRYILAGVAIGVEGLSLIYEQYF